MFKHELGASASDIITGFKGTIIGRTEYIGGCYQYLIVPKVSKDGKYKDSFWLDENRLKVSKKKPIVLGKKKKSPEK